MSNEPPGSRLHFPPVAQLPVGSVCRSMPMQRPDYDADAAGIPETIELGIRLTPCPFFGVYSA